MCKITEKMSNLQGEVTKYTNVKFMCLFAQSTDITRIGHLTIDL